MKKACFLDRDGVIIADAHYLRSPDRAAILPGVCEALKILEAHGVLRIVVSNQSGVARGFFSEENIHTIHAHIDSLLNEKGASIDAYYYCPHHPQGTVPEYTRVCSCRKPGPGMILEAAEEYEADLGRSLMVGDKMSDLEAGRRAGCSACLVTDNRRDKIAADALQRGFCVADDLLQAVQEWIGPGSMQ